METNKHVVVTGIGVISPVGLNWPDAWSHLVTGCSGVAPITLFDASNFDVQIAGEAHEFDPLNFMPSKEARRMDRFTQFAVAALEEALLQSRLVITDCNAPEVGVVIGSGVGGIWTYTAELEVLAEKGSRRVNPFLIPSITIDVPAVHIALRTGAQGPNMGVASACATGADAIGQAFETIRRGHARAMFAGGFEAAVTPIGVAAFDRMRALSHRNQDPQGASRPFDLGRDGFVMAEGGALLVLEELEFALQRGAEPLAEILSYAAASDAVHLAAPDVQGAGAARCMQLAIERAGLDRCQVSYVNAHGTSTPTGDPAETRAIKTAFGDHAYRIPISSTKSMTGHLLGGAGAFESAVCVQVIRTGIVPPTLNLTHPDPACDLDYTPLVARQSRVEIALTNSFGFGGHNVSLLFGPAPTQY
jgi:3-oxoacyl-[acyl-carrier-protein] synthase II